MSSKSKVVLVSDRLCLVSLLDISCLAASKAMSEF